MKHTILLAAICLVRLSCAQIPSLGQETAASFRAALNDSDFVIRPAGGVRINTDDFRARIADVSNFPALGGPDVQSQVVRVRLRAGRPFVPHFHPRGSETLNAIRGSFRVSFTFEGLEPRTVENVIRKGESTVFPQGLPHTTACISDSDCLFLSVFNTADPGLVPVSM